MPIHTTNAWKPLGGKGTCAALAPSVIGGGRPFMLRPIRRDTPSGAGSTEAHFAAFQLIGIAGALTALSQACASGEGALLAAASFALVGHACGQFGATWYLQVVRLASTLGLLLGCLGALFALVLGNMAGLFALAALMAVILPWRWLVVRILEGHRADC